jgi:hypothetical protein
MAFEGEEMTGYYPSNYPRTVLTTALSEMTTRFEFSAASEAVPLPFLPRNFEL